MNAMNLRTIATAITVTLAALLFLLSASPVQAQGVCPGEPLCREVTKFSATVTEFRVSPNTVGNRPVNVTVRFTNKTAEPLILGYVDGTAAAFDDRGNKYEVQNSTKVRGIGLVQRGRFDPKFTLGPGESSDAKLELNFFVNRNVIVGTAFDLEMGVREIEPVAGNQYQLGREHALSWQSLANAAGGRAPVAAVGGAGAAVAGAAAAAGAARPAGDPCQGFANCASSGPVVAKLTGVTAAAPQGNNQTVTVRVAFQNLGATPLILNYKQGSGLMLDEKGQQYKVETRAESVQGIPVSTRDNASSQFSLRAGETRNATFQFRRFVGKVPPGTVFSPSLVVEQYELLPSNQLKLEREHALSFGEVRSSAGAANAVEALKNLGDLLKKKR
jgi:hypothetical protein